MCVLSRFHIEGIVSSLTSRSGFTHGVGKHQWDVSIDELQSILRVSKIGKCHDVKILTQGSGDGTWVS